MLVYTALVLTTLGAFDMPMIQIEVTEQEMTAYRALGGLAWFRGLLLRRAGDDEKRRVLGLGGDSRLEQWAKERLEFDSESRVSSKDLYRSFANWFEEEYLRPLPAQTYYSIRKMSLWLQKSYGAVKRKSGSQGFDGIRLRSFDERHPDAGII